VNETAPRKALQQSAAAARLREAAIGALFALVQLIPGLLRLPRKRSYWTLFRIALGVSGAALVLIPLGSGNNWVTSFVGLSIFATAILLPYPRPDTRVDRKAGELGALIVANGGVYRPANASAVSVRLFVNLERLWALDSHFQSLLDIPAGEISYARAEENDREWSLRITWADRSAEFSYRGIFAERRARLAETALLHVLSRRLPVTPKRRAAASA